MNEAVVEARHIYPRSERGQTCLYSHSKTFDISDENDAFYPHHSVCVGLQSDQKLIDDNEGNDDDDEDEEEEEEREEEMEEEEKEGGG